MLSRRSFIKTSSIAAAGAVAAMDNSVIAGFNDNHRTFILVHGAWHGGWCWRRVADILVARGHRVFTPSLTGLGDRAHLFSKDISMQTHVEDILSIVKSEELDNFVLVGHSYGGMVISGVADTLRERVSHYVYLDARLPFDMNPGAGFSWSGFDAPELRETRLKFVQEEGGGVALPPPAPGAFAVTEEEDAAWLQRQLRPMPLQTYLGTFTFKNSGSNGMKRTYIAAVNPSYTMLVPTHNAIKADLTWSFTTIDTGHDAMVTAPDDLASLLMEI